MELQHQARQENLIPDMPKGQGFNILGVTDLFESHVRDKDPFSTQNLSTWTHSSTDLLEGSQIQIMDPSDEKNTEVSSGEARSSGRPL